MLATGGLYGIAADEETGELYVVSQGGEVRTYRKEAQGRDRPIREISGPKTQNADSHGIAIDPKRKEIFVLNWGTGQRQQTVTNARGEEDFQEIPGSGFADPPSITVFRLGASGNVAPLRVIKGPKTQLNWPTGVAVSSDHGEIFVANDTGNSITVYPLEAQGDVAPIRVIKGPKSRISNPKGIAYDPRHDELFVANFSNHAATVYPRTANGDVPPIRMIRSAPLETQAPMMGNPHTVVYNPVREEILVGQ
jgi:DNA-binding beta-propeller fold protein YncE